MQNNPMGSKALLNDRLWFKQNLDAVIRFRPEIEHEFAPLLRHGSTPPRFIPSHLKQSSPFNWVVVVNLQRMLRISTDQAELGQMRLRIQTIAIPQLKDQRLAEKELTRAIAAELLLHADQNQVMYNKHNLTDIEDPEDLAA